MIFFQKLRSSFVEFGFGGGLLYLIGRALERTGCGLYRYYLVAQPVPPAALLPAARGRSIAVRQIAKGDPALVEMPLTPEVLRYRFGQNAVCFGAFKDGRMIGCLWLCLGPYLEDEVRCLFVPSPAGRASWDFDVYLHPTQRLGFAFARLWDEANAYLRERGVGWSMSRISVLNRRSLAAHGRLGIRRLGSATFLRFGPVQVMLSSLRPYFHVSTKPEAAPVLALACPGACSPGEARPCA